jgi:RecA/RadA recombinase
VLITQTTTRIQATLHHAGVPQGHAREIAHTVASASGPIHGGTGGIPTRVAHAVAVDFAHATHTVVLLMALVMAAAFITAVIAMPRTRAAQAPVDVNSAPTSRGDRIPRPELSISEASQR